MLLPNILEKRRKCISGEGEGLDFKINNFLYKIKSDDLRRGLNLTTCVLEMVYNDYTKQRIVFYLNLGLSSYSIAEELRREGCGTTRQGIAKFVKRYRERQTIARKPGSGHPTKITEEVLTIVEDAMQCDDETTAVQLHSISSEKGVNISLNTILHSRKQLGWTFRGSAYCQLIREENKHKRLEWARKHVDDAVNDEFKNVIWTDETSLQVESHRRFCCRKVGQRPKPKPR